MPLDENVNLHETRCYELMKFYYWQYENGIIGNAEASDKKRELHRQYDHDCILYSMYKAVAARERKISEANIIRDIELSDNELCKRLVRIMDGRESVPIGTIDNLLNGIPFGCDAPDVVEVVRCKECKHANKMTQTEERLYINDCVMCSQIHPNGERIPMLLNDFCSHGERKE